MATIVLRLVKGSKLTKQQADDNWNNINVEVEAASAAIIVNANNITTNSTNIANKIDKTTGTLQNIASAITIAGTTNLAALITSSNIVSGGSTYPSLGSTYDSGLTGSRWANVWADLMTTGTLSLQGGNISDSSGAISFGNENLSTTGLIGVGAVADLGTGIHINSSDVGTITGGINSSADDFVLEGTTSVGMTLVTDTAGQNKILFGDTDDADIGYIIYSHGTDDMLLGTNSSTQMTIASSGNVGVGTSTPGVDLSGGSFDQSGTVFHVKDTIAASVIIEGSASHIYMIDSGGAADDKWAALSVNSGTITFSSFLDSSVSNSADILVMDMGTGNVGIGVTPDAVNYLEVKNYIQSSGTGNPYVRAKHTTSNVIAKIQSLTTSGLMGTESNHQCNFIVNNVQNGYLGTGRGLVWGAPTGSHDAAGTIWAQAVYDDNTLLTCYVFDQAVEGDILESKWDDRVPNRTVQATLDTVESVEITSHSPMRKFKSRMGTMYDPMDIDKYAQHWKDKKHLTAMPNEETFDVDSTDMSMGSWVQRLVETVEIQAVHIDTLNQRLKVLEAV